MADLDPIRIRVTEVGPRDGLQNEPVPIPTEAKIRLVDALSAAGFPEIEVSSFVNPRWVPQLADASEVFDGITRHPGTIYSGLVPNEKGLDRAMAAGVSKVAVFTAATESFCQRNINTTIADSIERFRPVVAEAISRNLPVRAYVSCIVQCPYEGAVKPGAVREVVERLLELGPVEVALGETLGVVVPDQLEAVLDACAGPLPSSEVTLHLHDTNRRALESVERAVAMGVRSFDAACGGLGGCPFAPGAAGNLATERLLEFCAARGWQTGVDQTAVRVAASVVRKVLSEAGGSSGSDDSTDSRGSE